MEQVVPPLREALGDLFVEHTEDKFFPADVGSGKVPAGFIEAEGLIYSWITPLCR